MPSEGTSGQRDAQTPPADGQERMLRRLYGTPLGRGVLKLIVRPWFSKVGGWLINRKVSCLWIKGFVRRNSIDLSECEKSRFKSFNDFFTRRLKPGSRAADMDPGHFISPCDSRLTAYRIDSRARFCIKDTRYTLSELIRNKEIAKRFEGGWLLLFRLSVDDYHRYCYVDDGHKFADVRIPGLFHTVNPIANDLYPIYKENSRVYSLMQTRNFGEVLAIEVGALLVGKISNHDPAECYVARGDEKGLFEFGGSTIVICVQEGILDIDEPIASNSAANIETKVRYGSRVGVRHAAR
ncbi:MAG: phosphatidylserine decarboxylase [bacterium]|nr:phosphatidylserine decarboxylase [bacterium]